MPANGLSVARARARLNAGLSLVEISIAMIILAGALLALLSAIVSSDRLRQSTREQVLATNAARRVIERLRSEDFATIYATYRPGQAAATFPVEGLNPDGATPIGSITFPTAGAPAQLCETVVDAAWGMSPAGRDLNGDGDATDVDVSATYELLPVRVTIRWRSLSGPTQIVVDTLITEK